MATYPVEFRQRVVELTAEGQSGAAIARVLGVSGSWVTSIQRLHRAGVSLTPKSRANRHQSLAKRCGDALRARVTEHPGTTLEDLKLDASIACLSDKEFAFTASITSALQYFSHGNELQ